MTAKQFARASSYNCKSHNYEEQSQVTLSMLGINNGGPMLYEDAEALLTDDAKEYSVLPHLDVTALLNI